MKRILVVALILFACIMPLASAGTWTTLGMNWNNWSGGPVHLYDHAMNGTDAYPVINMGDSGTGGSGKYQDNAANGCFWFQFDNNGGAYYSTMRIISQADIYGSQTFVCNGVSGTLTGYDWKNFSISGTGPVYCEMTTCTSWAAAGEMQLMYGDTPPPLEANFTGSPLTGNGPLEVTLQDNSSNVIGSATYIWSISPGTGVDWFDPDQEGETQVITIMQDGDYTVSLNVTDSLNRTDTETKVSYISVYNSTSNGTIRIRPLDVISGYPIQGANISVWDRGLTTWKNTTATTGEASININNGDLFDAYGSAYGYDNNDFTGETAVNGKLYILPMYPATMPGNVSAGNVTLYVTVVEADDSTKRISGALVSVAAPWPKVITGTTNSNGLAQFTVPNKTALMIAVSKSGYMGASLSVNSGTGNGGDAYIEQTVLLEKLVKTTAPTQTTLPGGGTPIATVTVIPGCEDPTSPECHTAQNSATMGWLSENSMSLVMFFVVCFIIFMIKGIGR